MAKAAKRKQFFILGFFGVVAVAVAFLVLREIPAPQQENVIELDAEHVLTQ